MLLSGNTKRGIDRKWRNLLKYTITYTREREIGERVGGEGERKRD